MRSYRTGYSAFGELIHATIVREGYRGGALCGRRVEAGCLPWEAVPDRLKCPHCQRKIQRKETFVVGYDETAKVRNEWKEGNR
jgi:rubredoxin